MVEVTEDGLPEKGQRNDANQLGEGRDMSGKRTQTVHSLKSGVSE